MATIPTNDSVGHRNLDIQQHDTTQRDFADEKTHHNTTTPSNDIEKGPHGQNAHNVDGFPDDSSKEGFETASTHKQEGVKRVEAMTSVWTKKSLWMLFAM